MRNLDPGIPTEAALLSQAAHTLRGASYQVVGPEAAPGELTVHAAVAAPYAHVTAPLRRLGDRYATEASLAVFDGRAVPAWVSERLIELARVMVRCTQRGAGVENAVVDLVEALVLSPRVGEMFRAVVVDIPREERSPDRHGSPRMARIQLRSPAVVGTVAAEGLVLGAEVNVRLDSADPLTRKVVFTIRDRT